MGRAEQRSIVAKVRVYELAKEFGVESKAVMAKLEEMGEFVRSASSTIEAPVVRRLKEAFNGGGAGKGGDRSTSGGRDQARRDQGGFGDRPRGDRQARQPDGGNHAGGTAAPSAPVPVAPLPGPGSRPVPRPAPRPVPQ